MQTTSFVDIDTLCAIQERLARSQCQIALPVAVGMDYVGQSWGMTLGEAVPDYPVQAHAILYPETDTADLAFQLTAEIENQRAWS